MILKLTHAMEVRVLFTILRMYIITELVSMKFLMTLFVEIFHTLVTPPKTQHSVTGIVSIVW